jgi:DNA-binding MarR family transcriptional regulator
MNDLPTSEPHYGLLHGLRAAVVGEVGTGDYLTLRQMAVVLLVYLADDPQTVRDLAQYLNVSTTVVSQTLNRLSKLGLARRQVNPADRRSVLAVRTEAGQALVARLKASLAAEAEGTERRSS